MNKKNSNHSLFYFLNTRADRSWLLDRFARDPKINDHIYFYIHFINFNLGEPLRNSEPTNVQNLINQKIFKYFHMQRQQYISRIIFSNKEEKLTKCMRLATLLIEAVEVLCRVIFLSHGVPFFNQKVIRSFFRFFEQRLSQTLFWLIGRSSLIGAITCSISSALIAIHIRPTIVNIHFDPFIDVFVWQVDFQRLCQTFILKISKTTS
ncbi:hypothetical protein BpHYR1_043576 [Brachionus plicatilis]|uniref:Uncharacterized protein n=1 Tax=Brachionus plicatilis TaxID=10195 RepID=A0A3M7SN03_BRAPC|nr:hypothetical protein BpHYR1_043576 [Brachionus plicatilis]